MKRTPFTLFALALAAALMISLLPNQPKASADEDQVLDEAMEVIARNYRLVRRQSRDASKNADTADKLAEMIAASVRGKADIPRTATSGELELKYRMVMNDLIIVLTQAENAALAGDQDKLKELVTAANRVKGEGHQLFIEE